MAKKLTNSARAVSMYLTTDAAGITYLTLPGGRKLYFLAAAVTANVTLDDAETTAAPAAGDFAITSHATGIGSIFRSDGTKWQFLTNA